MTTLKYYLVIQTNESVEVLLSRYINCINVVAAYVIKNINFNQVILK